MIPAGVDSLVAARADSIADRLFVSIGRERRSETYKSIGKNQSSKSDTLWKYFSDELKGEIEVTGERETQSVEAFNKGAVHLQELSQINQNAEDLQTKVKVGRLLQDAQTSFERAVVLNPFDLETRSWLARVYQTQAVRFLDDANHEKATTTLEKLVRIEKGEHTLFARLAETYYALENWQEAHLNFNNAEMALSGASGMDFSEEAAFSETAVDTSTLFYYVYYQGDAQIKMHDAENGLANLNRALGYASTDRERSDIDTYIAWINWDDGNTKAVEARDKYLAMEQSGEYREAALGFLQLIPNLKTVRAKDEILWRLGALEFQFLERQEQGIERIKQIVSNAGKTASGAPIDTSYQRYFDSYGVMCHNLGLENFKKNRKVAFMYFQQATQVFWESRAKSYLEIAKMSRNNPNSAITACRAALTQPEQLDVNEQMSVYQLLVEAFKRRGKFNEARQYYAKWMELRNGSRRVSR